MVELKTYKYKLYNRDALKYLDNILVIAGRIYNHCIALHRRYYAFFPEEDEMLVYMKQFSRGLKKPNVAKALESAK